MKNKKNTKTKCCAMCKKRKYKSNFFNNTNSIDGKGSYCKPCAAKYAKKHKEENLDHYLQNELRYRIENADRIKAYNKEYYSKPKNAKRQAAYQKKYRKTHREDLANNSKRWYERNKEYCRVKAIQRYYDNRD